MSNLNFHCHRHAFPFSVFLPSHADIPLSRPPFPLLRPYAILFVLKFIQISSIFSILTSHVHAMTQRYTTTDFSGRRTMALVWHAALDDSKIGLNLCYCRNGRDAEQYILVLIFPDGLVQLAFNENCRQHLTSMCGEGATNLGLDFSSEMLTF